MIIEIQVSAQKAIAISSQATRHHANRPSSRKATVSRGHHPKRPPCQKTTIPKGHFSKSHIDKRPTAIKPLHIKRYVTSD